jgi:hypothetical protein
MNHKLLVAKSIGVALTRRQVPRLVTDYADPQTLIRLFNVVFTSLADVLMYHASRIQRRMTANTAIPGILVPC